ncbi:ROK family glucokinase [Facklamia sp. 7083-14-GEN3]|uniref:ROK family glucokinase n=1 Tax=Facklamia sp. 7083-14-GEN3 TaxID=2973478 RepID=UPI00215C6118|nr:ROK family glucokinase [Facklamia sp. 7083-14-GEN3]MCR8968736.1 ROK family glucokinase [Facklamia sp. 7083-14-GEN3]
MKKIIGIDLGGTSVKMAIISHQGHIIEKWSMPTMTQNEGHKIVPSIIESIQQKIKERHEVVDDYIGIGMGSPGTILEDGSVKGAYNLNWVNPHPVKALFEKEIKLPFIIINDANSAALGELWQGAGKGCSDLVMLTLGTGVGGGIICQNRLIEGASGSAGEIGHITVDFTDKFPCSCGKYGCLEAIASAKGLNNLGRIIAKDYQGQSSLYQEFQASQSVEAEDLITAAKANDDFALKIFGSFSKYLGLACSYLANILNPQRIVIGGGISKAGEYLKEAIDKNFQEYVFQPIKDQTQISLAELGNDAGILGAAYLILVKESGKL